MSYEVKQCLWEITVGCNLHCMHCGSACDRPLPDELTTKEALELVRGLKELGIEDITLTGGEPLVRKDWRLIAGEIRKCGIKLRIISNGSLLDRDAVGFLKECGVYSISISVDGTEEVHDQIRGHACYHLVRRAFGFLKEAEMSYGAVTTIMRHNLPSLEQMKEELIDMGVSYWQLQMGLPQGALKEHMDTVIGPEVMKFVIDWAYEQNREGRIAVILADCFGYYTRKEAAGRQMAMNLRELPVWEGCSAGIRTFGILQNGDIVGCTYMRNFKIAGNIRQRSIRDIWEDENSFAWRRNLTADKLKGYCKTCIYAQKCLGGCSNSRLAFQGDIYAENPYCVYRLSKIGRNHL